MKRAERRLWAATESLDDLAAVTVRWLHEEVQETPGHGGPPDPETARIRDDLAWLNRCGFVTTNSQPGIAADAENRGQCAWVEGYTRPSVAAAIQRACDDVGLVTEVWPVDSFRPWWRRGDEPRRTVLDLTWDGIGDGAWDDVEESVYVDVYDPEEGRVDLLWDTLMGAISAQKAGA